MKKSDFDIRYGHALDRAFALFKEGRRREIEMQDTLDMMRDEFQRILALTDTTEEQKGICERDAYEIEQRVSVIQQRDEALDKLSEARTQISILHEFIKNGVEFGYITVPDKPDPALEVIREVVGR